MPRGGESEAFDFEDAPHADAIALSAFEGDVAAGVVGKADLNALASIESRHGAGEGFDAFASFKWRSPRGVQAFSDDAFAAARPDVVES